MISLILMKKICSLLLVLLSGALLVRTGVLEKDAGKPLSAVLIYLVSPCSILESFQIEYTAETRDGLLVACLFGLISIVTMLLIMTVLGRLLHMEPVEKASVVYSNAGNLIIPIVSAVFGKNYVIFCSAYICIQTFFMWSHGKSLLCGETHIDFKKMLLNINILSIFVGVISFFAKIEYPAVLNDTIGWVGDMIGPLAMLVAGIQLGGTTLRKVLAMHRVWLVAVLRLVIFPLMSVVLLRVLPFGANIAEIDTIKSICLLGMIGPAASNITAMSRLFGGNAEYASVINMVTTLLCVITIPCVFALFQL